MYIPLGGSRVYADDYKKGLKIGTLSLDTQKRAAMRRYVNILAVWLLTGLWHGAGLNFVAWGLYYGIILILEKRYILHKLNSKKRFAGMAYTMFAVIIGWVFFASPDFASAFRYIGCMFNITNIGFSDNIFFYRLSSHAVTLMIAVIGATPIPVRIFKKLTEGRFFWVRPLLAFAALFVCTAYLVDNTYNPFLYFRF